MADFRQFTFDLDAFASKMKLLPAVAIKRVAFDLYRRVTKHTPVDTGRARASWTIAVNSANRRVLPATTPGVRAYADPRIGALNVQPGDSVVISNNLPYITALEDGHSRREPHGMVKVSIAETRANMATLMKAAKNEVLS